MPTTRDHRQVGLNAQLLAPFDGTYRSAGINQYIKGILSHLPSVASEFGYTAFAPRGVTGLPENLRLVSTAWPVQSPTVRILWEQTVLPGLLVRHRVDLLHSLAFVSPVWLPRPSVVTVYDLSFELMPERFPPANRMYLSAFTRLSCRRAKRVIAISESTRVDIARRYGLPLERIDVAYPGVPADFRPLPRAAVDEFRRRRGLPERFILYLGTLEPRKNLPALVRAFAKLNPDGVEMVLAGGEGWGRGQVQSLLDEHQLHGRVHCPGFVPAEELPWWYNAAEVFAYPSAYEGFGIPPVEAMACGTPVVVSDSSSLPEAVGAAGLRVPAGDSDALAWALNQLLNDRALRDELREKGPRQAAQFTWERAARATAAAYRRALEAV